MARKRIVGKTPSAVKKVYSSKKEEKSKAMGTYQMGRETLFAPTKAGGLMRLGLDPSIRKALPKQQRLTLHDLRMAAISVPLALGSAYVGYKSTKKIARALKKRPLKQNWNDLKEDAKKNLMHSLDLLENVVEEKKSPILFRKKRYPRGGGYYQKKSGQEE